MVTHSMGSLPGHLIRGGSVFGLHLHFSSVLQPFCLYFLFFCCREEVVSYIDLISNSFSHHIANLPDALQSPVLNVLPRRSATTLNFATRATQDVVGKLKPRGDLACQVRNSQAESSLYEVFQTGFSVRADLNVDCE